MKTLAIESIRLTRFLISLRTRRIHQWIRVEHHVAEKRRPDGSVWSRSLARSFCSDAAIPALTNRTDRKLFPLSPSERSHVVSYDFRGNATHETESFDRATARAIQTILEPWSTTPASTLYVAGLAVRAVDHSFVTNSFEYDAIGQRIAATDGRGNMTSFVYDSFGLLTSSTDAATNTTSFVYDADGNLLFDGERGYAWDAENRLVAVTEISPDAAERYAYDDAWHLTSVSNGAGIVQYYWADDRIVARTDDERGTTGFIWGLDLAGTLQECGGVGALLAVEASDSVWHPSYDANGNVFGYYDGQGAQGAAFDFSATGQMVRHDIAAPSLDETIPSFSTKMKIGEAPLYYYGYRCYSPALGRWLNRDPVPEEGMEALLQFCENDYGNSIDGLGLRCRRLRRGGMYTLPKRPCRKKNKWYRQLPACPCNLPLDCDGNPKNDLTEKGWTPPTRSGHKGATWEIRKALSDNFPSAGQQCTYDSKGQLINKGSGAGTPDMFSPDTLTGVSFVLHGVFDYMPWRINKWIHGEGEAEDRDHKSHPPNRGKDENGKPCPWNTGE